MDGRVIKINGREYIDKEMVLEAIRSLKVTDTMGVLDHSRLAAFNWTKYDIHNIVQNFPNVPKKRNRKVIWNGSMPEDETFIEAFGLPIEDIDEIREE